MAYKYYDLNHYHYRCHFDYHYHYRYNYHYHYDRHLCPAASAATPALCLELAWRQKKQGLDVMPTADLEP